MTIGLMIQFGTISGSIFGMPQIFGTTTDWWKIYAFESVLILIVIIIINFIPESPR